MSCATEPVKTGLGFAEYLEYEQQSQVKHEFVAGQLFGMAGGSDRHNRPVFAIAMLFEVATQSNDCRVYPLDMLVRTPEDVGYYPDVLVTCQSDNDTHAKRYPCLTKSSCVCLITLPDCVQR
jgi:Uma2 family endonuclease